MPDPTVPRFVEPRVGALDAVCGEERLTIRRTTSGKWKVQGRSGRNPMEVFDRLRGAKDFAFDWLVEHA